MVVDDSRVPFLAATVGFLSSTWRASASVILDFKLAAGDKEDHTKPKVDRAGVCDGTMIVEEEGCEHGTWKRIWTRMWQVVQKMTAEMTAILHPLIRHVTDLM
jgi:hypothetical protein